MRVNRRHVRATTMTSLMRRLRFGEPIVVVSGLPRSGTSMLMKMLAAGGLPVVTDGQRTADEDNPEGYFEVERIKALAQETDRTWLSDARGKGVKVISYLLRSLPEDHNYRVVFIRRDIDEVLASQGKMMERRGEKDDVPAEKMREVFAKDVARALELLARAPQFEVLQVEYASVVARPLEEARRIADFVGGGLDPQAMAAAVRPALYRNRAGRSAAAAARS
jgi:sulfotransferase family protein